MTPFEWHLFDHDNTSDVLFSQLEQIS